MKLLSHILIFFLPILLVAEIPLAKNGRALAEIVTISSADKVLNYAAHELRRWVREISGAELPLVHNPGKMPYKIILSVNPSGFPDDLKKLKNNDGYAVRERDGKLYIFGSKSKGVLNGIYKLLFKNSDIIWARPNPEFGTIFSKKPDFKLTVTDYIDIPVFALRGWQMTGGGKNGIFSDAWQVRNGSNWSARTIYCNSCPQFGNITEYGGGHNLVQVYLREKKYFKRHPEYYPLIDGKRVRPSAFKDKVQLCFSSDEMTKAFIRELDAKIRKYPDYDTYRIMIEDNYHLCNCPACLEPLKLDNGESINKNDKAFRSTQFFLWLNRIARYMQKKYPDKKILTFSYFFTEIPPRCRIEPNIDISFCPIQRNSKAPLSSPLNSETRKRLLEWTKKTRNLTLREYYGLTGAYPRPIDAIAAADWKYVNKLGINKTYSQMYSDDTGRVLDGKKVWDVNGLYFWTTTNAAWNPFQDIKLLRKEFLKRVYGNAADELEKFYAVIEQDWLKSENRSDCNDRARTFWYNFSERQEVVEKCRKILDAATAKISDTRAAKMLAGLRAVFEAELKLCEPFSITAVKTDAAVIFDPDFSSGDWEKACPATKFTTWHDNKEAGAKSSVKILYDKNSIYFGIKCINVNSGRISSSTPKTVRDKWPKGEKFELFITGRDKENKTICNQIVFDINGNIYDARDKTTAWNGNFVLQRKIGADSWSVMLTLPFKEIMADPQQNVKVMFIRYCKQEHRNTEVSFWQHGIVHDYRGFGNLIFNK
ncbi:MAG: DUF4838 domain-containing protein [Victivallales bacterium]